jgi:glutathione S-transferase
MAQLAEDVKAKNYNDFLTIFFPRWLTAIENRIKKNSNQLYLVGESFTIADFALAGFFTTNFYNPLNTQVQSGTELIKKDYPVLAAYLANYNTVFAEYLAARKPSPW